MHKTRRKLILASAISGILPSAVIGQGVFPSGPVKIVVPFPPGGGADVLARVLGKQLSDRWGKPVIIENRPGAATSMAAGYVAKAAADGATLLLTSDTTLAVNPALYSKLPYNADVDFAPISQLVQLNQMLLVRNESGITDLNSFIQKAKASPGKLTYASYGSGSEPHLAMEMLKNKAGIFILHVPYRGVPLALNALLGGEVDFTFSGVASALPHIQSGKLRAIAIGGSKRTPLVGDIPTFAELGYPMVPARAWFGLVAPANTPASIVQKIAQDVRSIADSPEFLAKDVQARGFVPIFNTPAEFSRELVRNRAEAIQLVKISGAMPE